MKKVVREKMFETNSSSVHSLLINPKRMGKNRLKMKNGYVLADFGKFGKDYEIYKTQNDKLSYLLTELYYMNHYETDIEDMYQFKYIEEAIMDYDDSVIGVKILNKVEPELDHQSIPEYGESKFVDYWRKSSIQSFIFNNDIWISTDCD